MKRDTTHAAFAAVGLGAAATWLDARTPPKHEAKAVPQPGWSEAVSRTKLECGVTSDEPKPKDAVGVWARERRAYSARYGTVKTTALFGSVSLAAAIPTSCASVVLETWHAAAVEGMARGLGKEKGLFSEGVSLRLTRAIEAARAERERLARAVVSASLVGTDAALLAATYDRAGELDAIISRLAIAIDSTGYRPPTLLERTSIGAELAESAEKLPGRAADAAAGIAGAIGGAVGDALGALLSRPVVGLVAAGGLLWMVTR